MTQPEHTYGPTCALSTTHGDNNQETLTEDGIPRVTAQFFYVSSLPIDDPLSPLPPIPSGDRSTQQIPPQPFSERDHAALEEAWLGCRHSVRLQSGQGNGQNDGVRPSSRHMFEFPRFGEELRSQSPHAGSMKSTERREGLQTGGGSQRPSADLHRTESTSLSPEHAGPGEQSSQKAREESRPRSLSQRAVSKTSQAEVMLSQPEAPGKTRGELIGNDELQIDGGTSRRRNRSKRRHHSPSRRIGKKADHSESPVPGTPIQSYVQDEHLSNDISGRPFARAPSGRDISARRMRQLDPELQSPEASRSRSRKSKLKAPKQSQDSEQDKVYVPVGVSRLHLVELPDLLMQPIYWSPINDTSNVIRATWFYRDTMLPLPVNLANRLELGYEYIKPFSNSYQDELQACIDNGASAEMKVVHRLWDDKRKSSRPNSGTDKLATGAVDEPQPAMLINDENAAAEPRTDSEKRMFETHSVIYIDKTHAQILRPSLLPSVSQKRRPLSSIRKGRQIGVAVVRGFDRKQWATLHPSKMNSEAAHAKVGAYMSQSGDATTRERRSSCAACTKYKAPQVTDLVLVIHGIGQKLSERVDSYHFTHAINGLRREFNVELASEAVQGNIQSNAGMMVLPVNWRLTVSFDNTKEEMEDDTQKFGLKDITPDTLPAVRSIISDVMLDIPYYLSHHKEKMTSAVIREANRVYRLWCRNNPGFQKNGRVHLIAHSLGSVMAIEILSNQPTKVAADPDLSSSKPSETSFEFNTTNLFCCGSPGGFFLLLNSARLIPRAGVDKPDTEIPPGPGVTGEAAQYGCLAVSQIYNILNRNDPISYLLNASVDADYAASLETANIPSASPSFFSRMGSSLRFTQPLVSDPYSAGNHKFVSRPPMATFPSTVELETHNFTREEVAEKRMYLLNDNGQIDFHLASGGGPLEIQYLSMLSAHSSYWISRDFVRFLVVEIGRLGRDGEDGKVGREGTVPVLRARKKVVAKRGVMQ